MGDEDQSDLVMSTVLRYNNLIAAAIFQHTSTHLLREKSAAKVHTLIHERETDI